MCATPIPLRWKSRGKNMPISEHDEIVDIDFIWYPHATQQSCVPDQQQFDLAGASHVLEYVQDPLGCILSGA